PRPDAHLSRLDSSWPEPAGEQVEEVDPVFDEDTAALAALPEPVSRRQVLVRGPVLEGPVEDIAQHPSLDKPADGVEERIVALHEVGNQQTVPLPGGIDQ